MLYLVTLTVTTDDDTVEIYGDDHGNGHYEFNIVRARNNHLILLRNFY